MTPMKNHFFEKTSAKNKKAKERSFKHS